MSVNKFFYYYSLTDYYEVQQLRLWQIVCAYIKQMLQLSIGHCYIFRFSYSEDGLIADQNIWNFIIINNSNT